MADGGDETGEFGRDNPAVAGPGGQDKREMDRDRAGSLSKQTSLVLTRMSPKAKRRGPYGPCGRDGKQMRDSRW